jgi:methionyl-tRNA formyltransferase
MKLIVFGHGSRYEVVKDALENAGHEIVRSMNPDSVDLIVLANYPKILKKEEYENMKYGVINCHAGTLPEYRGSSILNWQIINGESTIYASVIQVDEGIDTGDILGLSRFDIEKDDTIVEVRKKADKEFSLLVPRIVQSIENGTVHKYEQSESQACYWHHRLPQDSKIDWQNMTAVQIHNLVRACETPYKAYCHKFEEGIGFNPVRNLDIHKSRLLQEEFRGISGRVVRKMGDGVVVIAKDRGLWIQANLKVGDQVW